eukprot:CAMPEP_0196191248 /NCGR_PEP_ID=MMETSP0911-20130528/47840_1 /TAXON_ID=49265 /ORGANISM="Thalassiosira rotula, Strain GSO102" /LENGTH=93 /DNA_ID=CAMNT_0041463281 /DNA_START=644 /DNA_END=928 /DNA_ORIENTATION=+
MPPWGAAKYAGLPSEDRSMPVRRKIDVGMVVNEPSSSFTQNCIPKLDMITRGQTSTVCPVSSNPFINSSGKTHSFPLHTTLKQSSIGSPHESL